MGNAKKIYGDQAHLEMFCATYLQSFDMIEAAASVGIALSTAYNYMHDPDIKAELARITEARLNNANITVERILRELANAAFLDIADLVDEKGVVHGNVHDIPESARRTITEVTQQIEKYKFDEETEIEFKARRNHGREGREADRTDRRQVHVQRENP
jgi:phage terminase small subunit